MRSAPGVAASLLALLGSATAGMPWDPIFPGNNTTLPPAFAPRFAANVHYNSSLLPAPLAFKAYWGQHGYNPNKKLMWYTHRLDTILGSGVNVTAVQVVDSTTGDLLQRSSYPSLNGGRTCLDGEAFPLGLDAMDWGWLYFGGDTTFFGHVLIDGLDTLHFGDDNCRHAYLLRTTQDLGLPVRLTRKQRGCEGADEVFDYRNHHNLTEDEALPTSPLFDITCPDKPSGPPTNSDGWVIYVVTSALVVLALLAGIGIGWFIMRDQGNHHEEVEGVKASHAERLLDTL